MLYRGQGHGGSEANPRNTGREAGIHPGWDPSPSQGTMHAHINTLVHTSEKFCVDNSPTCVFLGGGGNRKTRIKPSRGTRRTCTELRIENPGAVRRQCCTVAPQCRHLMCFIEQNSLLISLTVIRK